MVTISKVFGDGVERLEDYNGPSFSFIGDRVIASSVIWGDRRGPSRIQMRKKTVQYCQNI